MNNTSNTNEMFTEAMLAEIKLSTSLNVNTQMLNRIFGENTDLVARNISLGRTGMIPAVIYYIDNMIDPDRIDSSVMQPILTDGYTSGLFDGQQFLYEITAGNLITRAQMKKANDFKEIMEALLEGEVIFFAEGVEEGLIFNIKGYESRDIEKSDLEPSVKGPKDSFVEVMRINIGLIRRRIHSPNLTFKAFKLGRVTQTSICIGYIKGICSDKLLGEVYARINKIDIDGILDSNYIEEFIYDEPLSLFPQIRDTERPDVASAALLEGRVVVIVDNTPGAMVIPGELPSLFHAAEDYYDRYFFSSLVRILRILSCFVALFLPSLYIAICNFHQEMIPTKLLISILSARTGVPLSSFAEALLMEITFEVLHEAGIRLPRSIGQAVSIVGGLVIGQAAVQASIVSPLMVIIVSLTAIATFTIPQYNFSHPIRILRFPLMILTATLGFYGLMLGGLFILIHICSLRSFGIPYLSPLAPINGSKLKDAVIRSPWWMMLHRPMATASDRMKSGQMQKPPEKEG